jgi:hypothetical protein
LIYYIKSFIELKIYYNLYKISKLGNWKFGIITIKINHEKKKKEKRKKIKGKRNKKKEVSGFYTIKI